MRAVVRCLQRPSARQRCHSKRYVRSPPPQKLRAQARCALPPKGSLLRCPGAGRIVIQTRLGPWGEQGEQHCGNRSRAQTYKNGTCVFSVKICT